VEREGGEGGEWGGEAREWRGGGGKAGWVEVSLDCLLQLDPRGLFLRHLPRYLQHSPAVNMTDYGGDYPDPNSSGWKHARLHSH
jgi:hypothetical protein